MFIRRKRNDSAARTAATRTLAVLSPEPLECRRLLSDNPGSHPGALAVAYDTLFFTATPFEFGAGGETFRSDGTEAGTFPVKQIAAGGGGSHYTPFNGAVYFYTEGPPWVSEEPGHGTGDELWRTDGTAEGTVLVKDIAPGMQDSYVDGFAQAGGRLFFYATDYVSGRELWATDGTAAGTRLVKDLTPRPLGTNLDVPRVAVGGRLLFASGGNGLPPARLCRSEGTDAGTFVLKDLDSSWGAPPPLAVAGGNLYFFANDPAT